MIDFIVWSRSNRNIVLIGGAVVIVVGYFIWDADVIGKLQAYRIEGAKKEQIQSIAELTIIRDDISEDMLTEYTEKFNGSRDIFLTNPGVESYYAINNIAQIKKLVGDLDGAEEAWIYAHELSPNSYLVNGNLAQLYMFDLRNYEKAEEFYLKAIAPENISGTGNLATYISDLYTLYHDIEKDDAKAEGILKRGLERLPDDTYLNFLTARFYRGKGDTVNARRYYDKVVALDPSNVIARKELESL